MSNNQKSTMNEAELDAFVKEHLGLLADDIDVNTLMTSVHAEASKDSAQASTLFAARHDGRPNWIHFS